MYDFTELLKKIRSETGQTQSELADALEVSPVLIAMIESGQKEPSRQFIEKLASKMQVAPNALVPFMYNINKYDEGGAIERSLRSFGMKLQQQLIEKKAKNILSSQKQERRYPYIGLRSKNEIAKRIAVGDLTRSNMLTLINDCLDNYDDYWKDYLEMSEPKKGKWVRNSAWSPLGDLQKLIDRRILKPYDDFIPNFIFGGLSGRNTKQAVYSLLGEQKCRIMLKMDMSRFFEHVSDKDIFLLFTRKLGCSVKAASILTYLCCVNEGPKGSPDSNQTLGRGFATSGRLAVWCNLDLFLEISWLIKKKLNDCNPKIAIYVDDICVTASKATPEQMWELYNEIKALVDEKSKCKLELNEDKTKVVNYKGEMLDASGKVVGYAPYEALGIKMNRNTLDVGEKTLAKIRMLEKDGSAKSRRSMAGLDRYLRYVRSK